MRLTDLDGAPSHARRQARPATSARRPSAWSSRSPPAPRPLSHRRSSRRVAVAVDATSPRGARLAFSVRARDASDPAAAPLLARDARPLPDRADAGELPRDQRLAQGPLAPSRSPCAVPAPSSSASSPVRTAGRGPPGSSGRRCAAVHQAITAPAPAARCRAGSAPACAACAPCSPAARGQATAPTSAPMPAVTAIASAPSRPRAPSRRARRRAAEPCAEVAERARAISVTTTRRRRGPAGGHRDRQERHHRAGRERQRGGPCGLQRAGQRCSSSPSSSRACARARRARERRATSAASAGGRPRRS